VDIVDGADVEAFLLVQFVGLGGEEDDGNVARGGIVLQSPADLIAVHAGHHHVEQDEIGLLGGSGDCQGLFAVGGHLGAERVLQHPGNDRNVGRRVVDDQDELPVRARHYLPSRFS